MSKPEYKILRNQPQDESYGQYVYSYDLQNFWEGSGIGTAGQGDDLYTIVTKQRNRYFEDPSSDSQDIYFPNDEAWGDLQALQFSVDHIFSSWRPVSNVFIGNSADLNNGTYIQRYYQFDDPIYSKTTSPNVVNLYFDLTENDYTFDVNLESQWDLLAKWYNGLGASVTADEVEDLVGYSDNYRFIAQPMKVKIYNWDWKPGDLDWDTISIETPGLIVDDLFQLDNITPTVFSHQYNEPGIKTIKAVVYSEIKNQGYEYIHYKNVEIRLNLGLDNIYFEDFTVLGGPDYKYLPWPVTSPIIGGISQESDYYKSIYNIVSLNRFGDREGYERYIAEKALNNDELGKSLGDCDLQQVRLNKYSYDMNYMLGISQRITTDGHDINRYSDFGYWTGEFDEESGESYSFSQESLVGEIFIDESLDSNLKSSALFELNIFDKDDDLDVFYDSVGNGNIGILIGDYKIKKSDKEIESMRDSVINVPKVKENPDDGAI